MSIEFNIARSGYLVRAASAADTKAVRMLLPELRDPAASFVAVDGHHELVIGAAAFTRSCRREPLAGPGVALHVIEPCRRQGVGSHLLQQVAHAARSGGANALYAAKRVDECSEEMAAWRRLGFSPCEMVEEHVLPLDEFEPRLAPLLARMVEKRRIPAGARIIPLYQADPAAVLQLHLDFMGGDRGDLYRRLRGQGPGAFHPRYSRVLMIDDKVRGCLLAHRKDKETATVDANIVDRGVRGSWANIWLKLEATRGARRLGIKNFHFTTFDQYTDTRSFTSKMGGTTVGRTALMMRSLAAGI